ncbi:MAG: fibrillarin-like rRNA/tRNA 2'-O-methyltransferase [Thermoplasmatales archaeon]|nr:fibrillarin-like rRNA/tRNA 2'-O-methyltransferase [Thermoplasmatales archaeon]
MQIVGINGVLKKGEKIFTENYSKGGKVYNEKLVKFKSKEFRSWNPYKSKLAAAILKGLKDFNIMSDFRVLYLGAATGTTVSHISDIVKDGVIYAVEKSPVAVKNLLELSKKRHNIIPVLADANHPDRYSSIVSFADIVYQDISQRNQADIFVNNANRYLRNGGMGILMIKARSIDVSLKPKEAYKLVTDNLKKNGFNITNMVDLSPYEKDHAAIIIST